MFRLKFQMLDIEVDITLTKHITILDGESGTGKTFLYDLILQYQNEQRDDRILCLNIDNAADSWGGFALERMKKIKNGLVFIDHADDVLRNRKLYEYMLLDRENHYIIASRIYGEKYSELANVVVENNCVQVKYLINTDRGV